MRLVTINPRCNWGVNLKISVPTPSVNNKVLFSRFLIRYDLQCWPNILSFTSNATWQVTFLEFLTQYKCISAHYWTYIDRCAVLRYSPCLRSTDERNLVCLLSSSERFLSHLEVYVCRTPPNPGFHTVTCTAAP
jgi:hypothetical protein